MEADRVLKSYIRNVLKCSVKDYCYTKDGDKNALEIDIDKEDYDKISVNKIVEGDFVFKKKLKVQENKNSLTLTFIYEQRPDIDISRDITTDNKKKYGVISPEGKFYECEYAGHNNLEYFLNQRSIIGNSPLYNEGSFEYFGWMKLSGAGMSTCEFLFDYQLTKYDFDKKEYDILKENKPTKEQFEAIRKYIINLGREYFNFNFHWFHINDIDELLEKGDDRKFAYAKDVEYEGKIDKNELYRDGQKR